MAVNGERRRRQYGRSRFLEQTLLEEPADIERSRAKRDAVERARPLEPEHAARLRGIQRACEPGCQLGAYAYRVRQIAQEQFLALPGLREVGDGDVIHFVNCRSEPAQR